MRVCCFFKKNLMSTWRKYSDILCKFPTGLCPEPAILIEANFQHGAMKMGIESQKFPRRLINNGEDNPADIRKQTAVVAEVGPQDAWYRENELPMGQTQQQMIPHVP